MKINPRFLQILCCLQIVSLFFSIGIAYGKTEGSFQLEKQISTNSWSIGLSNNENELFVADGISNKILVFDLDGNLIRKFLLSDSDSCKGHIHGITIFEKKIYSVKENSDCIGIYDLEGELLKNFGSTGKEFGRFNSPQNIEIFDKKTYVTDNENKRIQVFDLEGNFIFHFDMQKNKSKDGFETPYDLEIYQERIYVTLPKHNNIQIFDLEGNFINNLETPDDNVIDPLGITINNDKIFLASGDMNQIIILNLKGEIVDIIESDFFDPHQVVIIKNKMYVLDTRNFLVKIFNIPETYHDNFEDKLKDSINYEINLILLIPLVIAVIYLIKRFYAKRK
jgi:DNA-binding beta-propeller fold protein YncE